MTDGEVKHSESSEHWEDEEESRWKREVVDSSEGEALFRGFTQCDLSNALRTFSMVHTLLSWLEAGLEVEGVPGRFRDNSRECSSRGFVGGEFFVAFDSGDSKMDRRPIRCAVAGTDWRGSRYVKVPEFQSLK
jgi:hypothetical protein